MSISRLFSALLFLLVFPLCGSAAAEGPLLDFKLKHRTLRKTIHMVGWQEFVSQPSAPVEFYKEVRLDGAEWTGRGGWNSPQGPLYEVVGGGVSCANILLTAKPDPTGASAHAEVGRATITAASYAAGDFEFHDVEGPGAVEALVAGYTFPLTYPTSSINTPFTGGNIAGPTRKESTVGYLWFWILVNPPTPEALFGFSNSAFSKSLRDKDSEDAAERRVIPSLDVKEIAPNPPPPPNAPTLEELAMVGASFRQKRTGRSYVRYASEFKLRLKLCPGEYILKWRVTGRHKDDTGAPEHFPQQREITIDENTPLDSEDYYDLGWIDIAQQLTPDFVYRLSTYADNATQTFLLEPKEGGCGNTCSSLGGSGGVGFGSVKAWFNLGKDASGASAGFVQLHSENIDANTHLPKTLSVARGDSATTRFEYDEAGALRQAQSDRQIIDIVPLDGPALGYQLKYYDAADATGWAEGRFRTFDGATPRLVWTVERLADAGGLKRIQITRSEGGADFAQVFGQNIATPSQWSFSEANGLRTTTRGETAAPGGDVYRTTAVSDGTYGTVSVKRERLHEFAWGEEIVEGTLDPDGAHPLTTGYEYHTSGAGQGQLWKTTQPDGTVTETTFAAYDTGLGVITSRIAGTTVTYPNGRVQTTVHGTLADLTANSADTAHSLVTTSETFGGHLVRRSWQIGYSQAENLDGDGVLYTSTHSIRAAASTAAWNDPRNEVTITRVAEPASGRIHVTLSSDGRITRTHHGLPDGSGIRTLTTETGPANATGTGLLAGAGGTRTETELDALGRIVARTTTDLASGWVTAFEQVTGWSAINPRLPTHISHLDGSEEVRVYSSCCGKLESVARHGRSTSYSYDDLGRQTKATHDGLTTETRYDAADRVRETLVYPEGTPGSAKLVSASTYDPAGRLTATTAPHAHGETVVTTHAETINPATGETTTVTTYPSDGDLPSGVVTELRAADGSTLRVTGNATAPVAYAYGAVTLPDAATWGFATTDRFFATTESKLDANGDATLETVTTYQDALGRTIKTAYADGASARRFYDETGRLEREVDPDGVTTLYAHQAGGFGEKTTVALDLAATTGGTRNGEIDLAGGHDRVTETTVSYAQREGATVRRTRTEVWETGSAATEVSVSEVSLDGLKSWQTHRGTQTTTTLVVLGSGGARTETTTRPDGTATVRDYAGDELVGEVHKDAAGATLASISYQYDDYGRLEDSTQTGLGTTSYTYFDDGRIESVTTPDPGTGAQTTTYAYNKRGWVKSVTQADAAVKHTSHYPNGRTKREWGARTYPVEYTYDAQGRMKTMTTWQDFSGESGAAVTTWNYHSQRGWLENKRYHDDKGPSYTYTPAGRLATRTWARSSSLPAPGSPLLTTYGYTDAGELESIDYSDTTADVVHTYDRAGRLHTTTDAAGTLTRSHHAASALLSGEAYSGAGHLSGRSVARTYDARHRPQSLTTDGGYGVSYTYDEAGRIATVGAQFHLASYGYKANVGAVESVTVKRLNVERVKHTRTTDALGRTTQVKSASGATIHVQRDYTHNAANQRTAVTIEEAQRWAYGYDELGQVTSAQKRLNDVAETPLPGYSFGYAFDDIGNRTETVVNGRAAGYTPDLLNRYASRQVSGAFDVRGEADPAATVTADGLVTTRTGRDFYREIVADNTASAVSATLVIAATLGGDTVTENRQGFLPQTPEVFMHDDDGNLTQDGRWDYTWDAENRLVAMETRASLATTFPELKRRLEFAYDAQGRRIRKVLKAWDVLGDAWTTTQDLRFIYDDWNLLTELDALNSNALVRSHVWGLDLSGTPQGAGGVGGLLWSSTPAHSFAACSDANGNIVAWINTATLAVSGRADYAAFGERVQQTGVAVTLPFGFSTKYTDKETSLLYYGFRYYNPGTGRWLSRDPIEENGGLGLYVQSENDSVGFFDVLGLAKSYLGCFTAEQRSVLREAEAKSKELLKAQIDKLKQLDVPAMFLANPAIARAASGSIHFRTQINDFSQSSLDHLQKIYAELEGGEYVYICGSSGENKKRCTESVTIAYSSDLSGAPALGRQTVVICDLFYGLDLTARAGNVAHELSHAHAELASRHRTDVARYRRTGNLGRWPYYAEFPEEAVVTGIEATIGIAVHDLELMLGRP